MREIGIAAEPLNSLVDYTPSKKEPIFPLTGAALWFTLYNITIVL
jgi:hypothetical protein